MVTMISVVNGEVTLSKYFVYIVGNNLYLCYSSVVIMLPVDLKRNANYTTPYSKRAFLCVFSDRGDSSPLLLLQAKSIILNFGGYI